MRTVATLTVVALLALDAAALHDVLVGEPDIRLEILVLAFSGLFFVALVMRWHRLTGR